MPTITELLRDRVHNRLGINDQPVKVNQVEMDGEIRQAVNALNKIRDLAIPRLVMGYLRYGKMKDKSNDYILSRAQAKLDEFKTTGNAEMLIDLANYCAIAFEAKNHPKYHFEAKDREG